MIKKETFPGLMKINYLHSYKYYNYHCLSGFSENVFLCKCYFNLNGFLLFGV